MMNALLQLLFSFLQFTSLHCTVCVCVCVCTVTNSQFDTIALALNRSIIHRTFLWATVSCCTEMMKLGFTKVNSILYSAVTKAHTLRRSDSWPHHKSFLLPSFSSCASGGLCWIFHIPSTFFLSPARKAGLAEALLKILCTQCRSIFKRQVKFGMSCIS